MQTLRWGDGRDGDDTSVCPVWSNMFDQSSKHFSCRSGQTFLRSGQTFLRSGQTFLRSGQTFLRSGQTFLRSAVSAGIRTRADFQVKIWQSSATTIGQAKHGTNTHSNMILMYRTNTQSNMILMHGTNTHRAFRDNSHDSLTVGPRV